MMRLVLGVLLVVGAGWLSAQDSSTRPAASSWRSGLSSLPATPPPNTTAQDVVQFERNMRMAATYMGGASRTANAAQWEANRALVRRMATYLYGLQVLNGDRQLRGAVNRAQHSFDLLGLAPYLAYGLAGGANTSQPQDAPLPLAGEPVQRLAPFDLNAPDMRDVGNADRAISRELGARYETDAAHSAGVWANAETLRENLEARGMGLNIATATAFIRLPQHFKSAAAALRNQDWEGARTHLEQAEAETEKISKAVGR